MVPEGTIFKKKGHPVALGHLFFALFDASLPDFPHSFAPGRVDIESELYTGRVDAL